MSEKSEKTEAQQREMPEPTEGGRPVPWIVIGVVAGLFAWAIGYLAMTYQPAPASVGDRRTSADFQVANAGAAAGGAIDGGQIYAAQCVACHQATGEGLAGVFPPLAGSEWVTGKAALAVQIVLHGMTGDLTVKGVHYNGAMPTFKDKLDDAEVAAVVNHIRTSFGNSADQIDAEMVKKERAATQAQEQPWNGEAELEAFK